MESNLKSIVASKKAIIFDLFHTLTAPEIVAPHGLSTSKILGIDTLRWNEQLMEKSTERLRGLKKDPYEIMSELAHAINPDISEDLIHKAVQNRLTRFRDALVKMPERTQEVIKLLKQQNQKVALVSNADVLECAAWNDSPVAPYFDIVLFSCFVGLVKPEIEIYQLCLRKLHENPEDCLFVGDGGSHEFEGAKQAGLSTIMYTDIVKNLWPHKLNDIMVHADYVINDLGELVGL